MARSLTWRCCPWCLTEDEKAAARIDQEINRILLEQKKRDRAELKLLLLGEWGRRRRRAGTRDRDPTPAGWDSRGARFWARRPRRRDIPVQPPRRARAGTEVAPGWQAQHALPARAAASGEGSDELRSAACPGLMGGCPSIRLSVCTGPSRPLPGHAARHRGLEPCVFSLSADSPGRGIARGSN